MIDDDLNNILSNNSNEFTSKIDAINNKNILKLIYLILFNKWKIGNYYIIILSILYFISGKIKNEKFKEQYYDLLSQIYFCFNIDKIKHLIVTIFSQSFIKEIENKRNFYIVSDIFGIQQSLFHSNRI